MRRLLLVVAGCWLIQLGALLGAPTAAPPAGGTENAEQGLTQAPSQARDLTVLDLLRKGGPVMYPLYLCSIVVVAFAIERAVSLQRKRILPPQLMERLHSVAGDARSTASLQSVLNDVAAPASPLARVVLAALRKAERPVPELEKAIEDAGAKEVTLMQRNNRIFSAVASVAPLLGLFGTVTGIIRAFMTVAANAESLGKTEVLAGGIYEALVTTAAGIAVAVPALILYFLCQDRVEKLVSDLNDVTGEVVAKLTARV